MRWAILCSRCRGAKSQVTSLHELPRGVHCESCNIDDERDFSKNVELASTPHVKVQREVEPGGVVEAGAPAEPGQITLRNQNPPCSTVSPRP